MDKLVFVVNFLGSCFVLGEQRVRRVTWVLWPKRNHDIAAISVGLNDRGFLFRVRMDGMDGWTSYCNSRVIKLSSPQKIWRWAVLPIDTRYTAIIQPPASPEPQDLAVLASRIQQRPLPPRLVTLVRRKREPAIGRLQPGHKIPDDGLTLLDIRARRVLDLDHHALDLVALRQLRDAHAEIVDLVPVAGGAQGLSHRPHGRHLGPHDQLELALAGHDLLVGEDEQRQRVVGEVQPLHELVLLRRRGLRGLLWGCWRRRRGGLRRWVLAQQTVLDCPAAEGDRLVPFRETVGEDADGGGSGGFLDEV